MHGFPQSRIPRNQPDSAFETNDATFATLNLADLKIAGDVVLACLAQTGDRDSARWLGRVWFRLEKEQRRRAEVEELERMYFIP